MSNVLKFHGPLSAEALTGAAEQLGLPYDHPAVSFTARLLHDNKIAEEVIKDTQEQLDLYKVDRKSGLLSAQGWTDIASEIVQGISLGNRASDRNRGLVLIYLDAEDFGDINKKYGHDEGDRRIGIIGGYLSDVSRTEEGDLLGRVGGDEFAWLASYDIRQTNAIEVLNSIEERLRDPIREERYPNMPTLRWNHTFYQPHDDLEAMVKRADVKGENEPLVRSQSQPDFEFRLKSAKVRIQS